MRRMYYTLWTKKNQKLKEAQRWKIKGIRYLEYVLNDILIKILILIHTIQFPGSVEKSTQPNSINKITSSIINSSEI